MGAIIFGGNFYGEGAIYQVAIFLGGNYLGGNHLGGNCPGEKFPQGQFTYNDTHREKKLFYSIQYKNGCLALSDLFHMFTQSIKFSTFYYPVFKEYRCLKNVIHQTDSKNEWLLLPASFTAQFGLVFVLTLENIFS